MFFWSWQQNVSDTLKILVTILPPPILIVISNMRCGFKCSSFAKRMYFKWTIVGKCNKHTRHATRTPSLWFLSLSSLQSLTSRFTPWSSTTCVATVGSLHNLQYNKIDTVHFSNYCTDNKKDGGYWKRHKGHIDFWSLREYFTGENNLTI